MVSPSPLPPNEGIESFSFDWEQTRVRNEQEWTKLNDFLSSSDIHAEDPTWAVIYDNRISQEDRETRKTQEISTMSLIDRIFEQMRQDGLNNFYADTPEHPQIDQELTTLAKQLICLAQRNHTDQNKPALSPFDILMICYEMWHVDYLYRKKFRRAGGYTARIHLIGAAIEKVKNEQLIGRDSIIAALHHDDAEDLRDLHPRNPKKIGPQVNSMKLLASEHYNLSPLAEIGEAPLEPDIIEKRINSCRDKAANLVTGVSKWDDNDIKKGMGLPESSDKDTINAYKDATAIYILLENAIKYGLRVIALRGADRKNNMRTINGQKPQRAKQISEQTAKTYVRVLRVFRFNRIADQILEDCYRFMRPIAFSHAEELRAAQHDRFFGTERRLTKLSASVASLTTDPRVEYIAIKPRPLGKILEPTEIDKPEYLPDTHPNDALAELYIQIITPKKVEPKHLTGKVAKLEDKLKPLREKAKTRPSPSLHRKIAILEAEQLEELRRSELESVARIVGGALDTELGARGNHEKYRTTRASGIEIDIDNPEILDGDASTSFTVRINDRKSEVRRPRGWLQQGEESPEFLEEILRDVVRRTRSRTKRLRIFDILEKKLLKRFFKVYTPQKEEKVFLEGANGIDYGASIHSDVLLGCLGIVASIGAGEHAEAYQINPLDYLPENHEIHIITSPEDPFFKYLYEFTPPDLRWGPFAGSQAKKALRSALSVPAGDKEGLIERRKNGLAYLQHISEIFNLGSTQNAVRGILYGTNQQNLQIRADRLGHSRQEDLKYLQERRRAGANVTELEQEFRQLKTKHQKTIKANLDHVTGEIGQAKIDPLEILFSDRVDQYTDNETEIVMDGVNVEINVPNIPGINRILGGIFESHSVNMETVNTADLEHSDKQSKSDVPRTLVLATLKPFEDGTIHDMARAILEIDYRFGNQSPHNPIRVTSNNFQLLCTRDRSIDK